MRTKAGLSMIKESLSLRFSHFYFLNLAIIFVNIKNYEKIRRDFSRDIYNEKEVAMKILKIVRIPPLQKNKQIIIGSYLLITIA